MDEVFSFKELYDVVLKAYSDITINNIHYNAGDVITKFDRISTSNFSGIKQNKNAVLDFIDIFGCWLFLPCGWLDSFYLYDWPSLDVGV